MKSRGWLIGVLTACALTPCAIAQSDLDATKINERYVPRLGDIMSLVQARHIKLWFAGKAANWQLADFELRQLKAGLLEAALMYEGIPVSNVTTMSQPGQSVADAIDARDGKRFAKAFGELTTGCNGCHQSMGRGFVGIQLPTTSPFSDQVFAPPKTP
jgi:hypothetical protein